MSPGGKSGDAQRTSGDREHANEPAGAYAVIFSAATGARIVAPQWVRCISYFVRKDISRDIGFERGKQILRSGPEGFFFNEKRVGVLKPYGR